MTGELKALKVKLGHRGDVRFVTCSSYQSFLEQCNEKFKIDTTSEKYNFYDSDGLQIDKDIFPSIPTYTCLRILDEEENENSTNDSDEVTGLDLNVLVKTKGKYALIGNNNMLVVVNVSKGYSEFLDRFETTNKGEPQFEDDQILLTTDWSETIPKDSDAYVFLCYVKAEVITSSKEYFQETKNTILHNLGGNGFKVYRELVKEFFDRFDAMIRQIKSGCFQMEMMFLDADKRRKMMENLKGVSDILNKFLVTRKLEEEDRSVYINVKFLSMRESGTSSPNLDERHGPSSIPEHSLRLLASPFQDIDNFVAMIKTIENNFKSRHVPNENILYTVLCIDVSSSMSQFEFNQIRKYAENFIKDIEKNPEFDEDVAIITFGQTLNILSNFSYDAEQHLTNLAKIKQENDEGNKCFFQAMIASSLALKKCGRNRKFKGKEIPPRIVFLTEGRRIGTYSQAELEELLDKTLDNLKTCEAIYPISCISDSCYHMAKVAETSGGYMVPESESRFHGDFHRLKIKQIDPNCRDIQEDDPDFILMKILNREQYKKK